MKISWEIKPKDIKIQGAHKAKPGTTKEGGILGKDYLI